jgi:hypothetical protein
MRSLLIFLAALVVVNLSAPVAALEDATGAPVSSSSGTQPGGSAVAAQASDDVSVPARTRGPRRCGSSSPSS